MTGWRLGTLVANPTHCQSRGKLTESNRFECHHFCPIRCFDCHSELGQSDAGSPGYARPFRPPSSSSTRWLERNSGIECLRSQGAFIFSLRFLLLGYHQRNFLQKPLEQEKVAVVSGHAFGADGYIRLSYATSDEVIQKGIDRLNTFCQSIR